MGVVKASLRLKFPLLSRPRWIPRDRRTVSNRHNLKSRHLQSLYRRHSSWTKSPHRNTYDLCAALHNLCAYCDCGRLSCNVGAFSTVLEALHAAATNHLCAASGIGEIEDGVIFRRANVDNWQLFELHAMEEGRRCGLIGKDVLLPKMLYRLSIKFHFMFFILLTSQQSIDR